MSVTATLPAPGALLRLGRVSNLPTVWTNVIAATAIAGGDPLSRRTGLVLLAMTLFYVGGMFLNDAFDREIDARERPKRPIPSGEVSAGLVFGAGFAMLAAGVALMALHGLLPGLAGLALAAAIVLYDFHHKANPFGPVVMGLCRALVYVGAATAAVGFVSPAILVAAGAMLAHVVGLTYAAKQECLNRIDRLWPLLVLALPLVVALPALSSGWIAVAAWLALAAVDATAVQGLAQRGSPRAVPQAVSSLIAAVSLVDALLVAAVAPLAVPICWLGYPLTRVFQRFVPGT
jgi:4-hydroxybenzoate polyprenyltransferase